MTEQTAMQKARDEWQRLYVVLRKAWLAAILGMAPDD